MTIPRDTGANSVQGAVRILQYTYGGSQISGIDRYLLDAHAGLDKQQVNFDFLFRYESPLSVDVVERLTQGGTSVFSLEISEGANPLIKQLQELVRLVKFFKAHGYDAIEVNMTSTFMCLQAMLVSMFFGTRVRIVHAHDAAFSESRIKRFLKSLATPILRATATDYWACAPEAAHYMFGAKTARSGSWTLVQNSIDITRFEFKEESRRAMRAQLDLGEGPIVGLVGRIAKQKNIPFALEVFAEFSKLRPDALLVVAGGGPSSSEAVAQVAHLNISERVKFLGARDDIPDILCALDVVLAPSLHEGFPIAALECQSNGLPMVVSYAFPESTVVLPELVKRMSLDAPTAQWVEMLRSSIPAERRELAADRMRAASWDRADAAKKLSEIYQTTLHGAHG